jgi:uncharacterized Zn-finger protein
VASNVASRELAVSASGKFVTGRKTMNEPTLEVLCKNCGKTFTAFLQEMADKNAVVTCPFCGKDYSGPPGNVAPPVGTELALFQE